MKPPNPKHATTTRPLIPAAGFRANKCGFAAYTSGKIRLDGKRGGKQMVEFVTTEQFADMLWGYLTREIDEKK